MKRGSAGSARAWPAAGGCGCRGCGCRRGTGPARAGRSARRGFAPGAAGVSSTASRSNSRRERWVRTPSTVTSRRTKSTLTAPKATSGRASSSGPLGPGSGPMGSGTRPGPALGRRHPPQDGVHPGHQLAEAERLGDVAGRPELEPEHHVELGVHRADHHDGDRGEVPHPAAHLDAVHARAGACRAARCRAGRSVKRRRASIPSAATSTIEALAAQTRRQRLAVGLLVLHHEHPDALVDSTMGLLEPPDTDRTEAR